MISNRSIEQTTARVAVLPARVVYLIAAGSREGFRRAAQEASSRWAGATELIVPLAARGSIAPAWQQMIEFGDYACLVNIDADGAAAKRGSEAVGLPVVKLSNIDSAGPSRFSTHPALVAEQKVRTSAPVMATGSQAPLWEIAAAGDLTSMQFGEVEHEGFVRRPRSADEIGRAQLAEDTLLDRGLEQFGEHQSHGGPPPSPTFLWVTKPNSLKDCIWFWNSRALRPLTFDKLSMYLVPHRGLDTWLGFTGASDLRGN